ncbi:MAG: cyclase family protein [Pseudomonadota bacterium]
MPLIHIRRFQAHGTSLALLIAAFVASSCAPEAPTFSQSTAPDFNLADYEIVDLSHSYGSDTVYWPTDKKGFQKQVVFEGVRDDGGFYAAFDIATAEHGGTHLDAPYHFHADGDKTDAVPLSRLIAPAVVIDVSAKAAADPLYRLSVEDVTAFETAHGVIAPGTIVLLRTGWSARWPDAQRYLGGADPSALAFPSFGAEAAKLLVEARKAAALGLDTASTDYGPSTNFPVHRIMGAANVPGFENLTRLDELPPTGVVVFALPMKIEGGSGGPLRAIALVPKAR